MHATQPQGRFCPDPRYSPNQPTGWVVTDAARNVLGTTGPELAEFRQQADAEQAPTSGSPVSVGDVLRSAAVYLDRHGWIQGCYYDITAEVFTPAADVVGAIGMVCYGGPVEAPAQHFDDPGFLDFEEAMLHLDRWLLVNDGSEAYEFNDAHGRQLADVLRVLREAADTPAVELIGALRAMSTGEGELAELVKLLIPAGIWAETANAELTPVRHVGVAHIPGGGRECPLCDSRCFCNESLPYRCCRCLDGLDAGRLYLNADGDAVPYGTDGGDV